MEHILSLLGLCKKAGRVEIGEEPVGSAARARKARVILVASDAAAGSVRRAYAFARSGECLCLPIPATKDQLGSALGRTSCAMAAITDIGFANAVVGKLAAADPEQYRSASERLALKAQRARERQQEQRRHEKNLRRGIRRARDTSPASPPRPKQASPAPAEHSPRRKDRRPRRQEVSRFAGSRPVKKGKGSRPKAK